MAEAAQSAGGETLKVLAGVQEGAEIELENRQTYSIGTDDDCTVVLLGEGIAGIHIEAAYLVGALSVLRCEQGVMLDGKPLPDLPTTIAAGQLLSFSGVVFAFGGADTDWQGLAEKAKLLAAQQPEQETQQSEEPEKQQHKRSHVATVAVSVVLALALSAAWFFLSNKPGENSASNGTTAGGQDAGSPNSVATVADMLAANDEFSNVKLVKIAGGKGNELVGLLDSAAAERKLKKIASASDMRTRVALKPQLLEGLRLSLDKYDAGLSYSLEVADGKIALKIGGICDCVDAEALKQSIRDNIPVIDSIKVSATPLGELLAELNTVIASRPEFGLIKINYPGGKALDVHGSLLKNFKKPDFERILDNYKPHEMVLREQFKTGPFFGGNVTSVLIGAKKHAVIDFSGREIRVALGSRLPGNFKLDNISRDKLDLEYEGTKYLFPTATHVPDAPHSE